LSPSRLCAETPAARKHPTTTASNFCLKLNILISDPPHASKRAWEGEQRRASLNGSNNNAKKALASILD
jgi:hypothetical protein